MRIYISHSSHYNYEKKLYQPIKSSGLLDEFEFIFPHEDKDIHHDVRNAIERGDIDIVIADISYPSTGQGIELAWFHAAGIPIECVYMSDSIVPNSLKLLTNAFFEYENEDELVESIKVILLGHS